MKKIYEKPQIVFESFIMSTNIAAGCEEIVRTFDKGTCAIVGTGNVSVFSGTMNICDFTPTDLGNPDDTWNGFCYHVPSERSNLFNS